MQNWTMNLIVFFVVAGSASWVLIGSSDDSVIEALTPTVKTRRIAVASHDICQNTLLRPEHCDFIEVLKDKTPEFKSLGLDEPGSIEELQSYFGEFWVRTHLRKGQPIRLSNLRNCRTLITEQIPEGSRVLAIRTSLDGRTAKELAELAKARIHVIGRPKVESNLSIPTWETILYDVRVFSVGAPIAGEDEIIIGVLAMSDEGAERLLEAFKRKLELSVKMVDYQ